MQIARSRTAILVSSFILTLCLTTLALRYWNHNSVASSQRVFLREGFDFRQLRSFNPDLSAPGIGTRLDFADLETSKRERLSSLANEDLLLFAVVAPDCPACQSSKDMMQSIRKTTNELGIKYLPVVFTKNPLNAEIQHYAATLGFEACVRWSSDSPPPEALRTMVTPSHILTNKDGVVLQTWLGTNQDAEVRRRMSEQISSDLFLISDVIKAAGTNNSSIRPQ